MCTGKEYCVLVTLSLVIGVLGFDLTILHTNDIHARYEETNKYSGACTDEQGKCYGGVVRLKTAIDELRKNYSNSLLLDGGDQYSGTIWFSHYGGILASTFMNFLGYDAMALGNHEFDRNIDGLLPFINNASFKILSSNIDATLESEMQNKYSPFTEIAVGGQKIGIIGYTTTDTAFISNPGSLRFGDEVTSIKSAVDTLKNRGVNKIIALGHAGFKVDKRIAAEVEGVDVIVGGHTNTFLYTGDAPSNESPEGVYPTVVSQVGGGRALVVQDYAFGKYLGVLHVTFDDNGVVTNYSGNPMLLDFTVAKDPTAQGLIDEYGVQVKELAARVIGRTLTNMMIDSNICEFEECNLGNLIADSVIHQNLKHADSIDATTFFVYIMNSGGIRSSLPKGNITIGAAMMVQPFRNTLERIKLQGKYLREALEFSAENHGNNAFLQISGLRIKYDLNKPVGQKVVEALVLCSHGPDCPVPKYLPLNDDQMYNVIVSNFILSGGDGYSVIKNHAQQQFIIGDLDIDMFIEYMQDMSPLYRGLDGRIQFVNSTEPLSCDKVCEVNGGDSLFRMYGVQMLLVPANIVVFISYLYLF